MPGSDTARLKIHRFIGEFDVVGQTVTSEDMSFTHQLRGVLKLRQGELVMLCDGKGSEAVFEIIVSEPKQMVFRRASDVGRGREEKTQVTLYCALLKREHFEYVVEKATELGAARIVPLITARTIKHGSRADRLERIAREAAELSGRTVLPRIDAPMTLAAALDDAVAQQSRIVMFEIDEPPIKTEAAERAAAFIGPEGGWTEEEKSAARDKGAVFAGLGDTILRGETAAILAVHELLRR